MRSVLLAVPAGALLAPVRSVDNGTCEYYRGSGDVAPFLFTKPLPNGTRVEVDPVADPSGLCVFPDAACGSEKDGAACCKLRPGFEKTQFAGLKPYELNMYLGLLVLVVPGLVQKCFARRKEASEDSSQEGRHKAMISCIIYMLFFVAVTVEIWLMIMVAVMTQGLLTVPNRNTMLAAQVFLTPVREIFQFIEDVMTVKINATLGAKQTHKVREVLCAGVIGGIFSGIVAALLVTGLCYWPSIVGWLLAPYAGHIVGSSCNLVPLTAEIVDDARPYVLLSGWSWPFVFANMALRGFLIGIGDWWSFGFVLLVEQGIGLFGIIKYFSATPTLTVLGWVGFVPPAVAFVLMVLLLIFRPGIWDKYLSSNPVREESTATSDAEVSGDELTEGTVDVSARQASVVRTRSQMTATWRETAKEGLLAMVSDLAVQVPMTVGVYLAGARLGMGAMYQISALQAAYPQYGLAWVRGLTYGFRIIGSQQIGARDAEGFSNFYESVVKHCSLLALVSIATTLPFPVQISFALAEQACEYASEKACLPIYATVFGGGDYTGATLQGSAFKFFVPSLCAMCFYQVFKAGVYACQDFAFMAKAGCLALVFVFLPSVFLADAFGSAGAILVPMYLPCLALAIAFAVRIKRNTGQMSRGTFPLWGQDGTDTDEESSESSAEA